MLLFKLLLIFSLSSCSFKALDGIDQVADNTEFMTGIEIEADYSKEKLYQKITYHNFIKYYGKNSDNSEFKLILSNINENLYPTDMDRDGVANEYNYNLSITVTLNKNKKQVMTRSFSENISISLNKNYYAAEVARDSYRKKLVKNIVEDVKVYLLDYYLKEQ
tara:strand:- start:2739 stop:3227 length:489 start_codon:yes stop_codon:yes gene_type:complete